MNENAVALRLARQSDLPFIMATERLPGFEQMVGRWSEAEHLATLARPNHAYLLGTNTAGECAAFAIIRDLDDAHGNLCLKRIAVTNPDRGFGSKFLSLVVDWLSRRSPAIASGSRYSSIMRGRDTYTRRTALPTKA